MDGTAGKTAFRGALIMLQLFWESSRGAGQSNRVKMTLVELHSLDFLT
jgi:hypothetical protein